MKKMTAWLLAVVLAVAGVPAMAFAEGEQDTTGPVYVEAETLLPANPDAYTFWYSCETPYVIEDANGMRLLDRFGNEVMRSEFTISEVAPINSDYYPVFAVSDVDEYSKYLVNEKGEAYTGGIYYDTAVLSEHWTVGVQVMAGDSAPDRDYGYDFEPLVISAVDLFYDELFVMTLTRDEVESIYSMAATGSYVVVKTRLGDDHFLCIGKDGSKNDLYAYGNGVSYNWWQGDEYYYDYNSGTYYHISGVPMYTPECPLTPEDVENPYMVDEEDHMTIRDLQGNAVAQIAVEGMELDEIDEFSNGYARIGGYTTQGWNYYHGVVNEDFEIVVPMIYDEVDCYFGDIFESGYARVVKDGKFGYVNEAGEVTCPLNYAVSACVMEGKYYSLMMDLDGHYRLVSAQGGMTETVYPDADAYIYDNKAPILPVADESGKWGIIDYMGNVLVPFETDSLYYFSFSQDGSAALVYDYATGGEAKLYAFGMTEAPEMPEVPENTGVETPETPEAPENTGVVTPETPEMPGMPENTGTDAEGPVRSDEALEGLMQIYLANVWQVETDVIGFYQVEDGSWRFSITSDLGEGEYSVTEGAAVPKVADGHMYLELTTDAGDVLEVELGDITGTIYLPQYAGEPQDMNLLIPMG